MRSLSVPSTFKPRRDFKQKRMGLVKPPSEHCVSCLLEMTKDESLSLLNLASSDEQKIPERVVVSGAVRTQVMLCFALSFC